MHAGRGAPLIQLATSMESFGFANHASVTRLIEQLRLHPDPPWAVTPRWWPMLRDSLDLGGPDAPAFRSATDVLLAAEAFGSRYRQLLERPPNSAFQFMPERDRRAADQVMDALSELATGPFGVAADAAVV